MLLGVLFWLELAEGKYHPKELGNPSYNSNGGADYGLLLSLTKKRSNRVVIGDGFSILCYVLNH